MGTWYEGDYPTADVVYDVRGFADYPPEPPDPGDEDYFREIEEVCLVSGCDNEGDGNLCDEHYAEEDEARQRAEDAEREEDEARREAEDRLPVTNETLRLLKHEDAEPFDPREAG
jgi:hypothetical protein